MIPISDSMIHVVGLAVAVFLAYIGLLIKVSMSKVAFTCEKIDAKIDKHIEVCEERRRGVGQRQQEVERRLERLEGETR